MAKVSTPTANSGSTESDRFRSGRLQPVSGDVAGKEKRVPQGERSTAVRMPRPRAAWLFDRALLLAEVAGALVVTWLVGQYIYTAYFDTAPHRLTFPPAIASPTTQAARQIKTVVPSVAAKVATPTYVAEVLPPEEGGTGGANLGEGGPPTDPLKGITIPNGLAVSPTPTPKPATATPTIEPQLLLPSRLRIPVMFLDSPVHEVMVNMGQWEVSPMDIGHHEGSSDPGETGNVVLAGHRDINSALFRDLDRLKPGDEVFVSNSLREYKYVVTDSFIVGPTHTEVMDPTNDKRVTLITCTPIGLATQRLIVTAMLEQ